MVTENLLSVALNSWMNKQPFEGGWKVLVPERKARLEGPNEGKWKNLKAISCYLMLIGNPCCSIAFSAHLHLVQITKFYSYA